MAFVQALAAEHLEAHSMMLLRGGKVFAEAYWEPYQATDTPLLYSISKTFTSAAVGLAVADGALGYDDLVAELFGLVDVGPKAGSIRIRDCLSMATGHLVDEIVPLKLGDLPGDGPWQAYFSVEPVGTPGVTFCYHQWASYILAEAVRRTTGTSVLQLLEERVFKPLAISDATWDTDTQGRILGWSGLHLSTESFAAFYQLLLDGGVSDGVRLLPQEWIDEHAQRKVDTSPDDRPDWSLGYGWQFWRSNVGYRGDGAFGQFGIVLPEQDMVVIITGGDERMQQIIAKVWQHLVPAVEAEIAKDERLDDHLAGLGLEPVWGQRGSGVHLSFENRKNRWRLTDDEHGWQLRWIDADGGDNRIKVGYHAWRRSDMGWRKRQMPVAASGAWVGWGHFVVKVVSLTSPHWILIHLKDDGSGWTQWNSPPLSAKSMADLALPKRR